MEENQEIIHSPKVKEDTIIAGCRVKQDTKYYFIRRPKDKKFDSFARLVKWVFSEKLKLDGQQVHRSQEADLVYIDKNSSELPSNIEELFLEHFPATRAIEWEEDITLKLHANIKTYDIFLHPHENKLIYVKKIREEKKDLFLDFFKRNKLALEMYTAKIGRTFVFVIEFNSDALEREHKIKDYIENSGLEIKKWSNADNPMRRLKDTTIQVGGSGCRPKRKRTQDETADETADETIEVMPRKKTKKLSEQTTKQETTKKKTAKQETAKKKTEKQEIAKQETTKKNISTGTIEASRNSSSKFTYAQSGASVPVFFPNPEPNKPSALTLTDVEQLLAKVSEQKQDDMNISSEPSQLFSIENHISSANLSTPSDPCNLQELLDFIDQNKTASDNNSSTDFHF